MLMKDEHFKSQFVQLLKTELEENAKLKAQFLLYHKQRKATMAGKQEMEHYEIGDEADEDGQFNQLEQI